MTSTLATTTRNHAPVGGESSFECAPWAEAQDAAKQALAIIQDEQANPDISKVPTLKLEVAWILHNVATLRWGQNDARGAEELYLRAIAMKEMLLGASHPDTALTMHQYACMLADLGRTAEAWDLEWRAMLVFEMSLAESHPQRLAAGQLWERLNA